MGPGLGNLNWNEIDIEMTGNRDSSVQFTTHHPGTPNSWSYGEIVDVDFNPIKVFMITHLNGLQIILHGL